MSVIVRVDRKGRIVIPRELRDRLGIGDAVRIRVEGGRLIIEPVRDPLEKLSRLVRRGTKDVEKEIRDLREAAIREAYRRLKERWR